MTGEKKNVRSVVKSFLGNGKETPGQRIFTNKLDISLASISRILKTKGIK